MIYNHHFTLFAKNKGLEDQLLGRVIQSEKQELEEMKNEMQESMVRASSKIVAIDDRMNDEMKWEKKFQENGFKRRCYVIIIVRFHVAIEHR